MTTRKDYYSTREVARLLGVTDRTVRRWIQNGLLKAVRIKRKWLIPESELKALTPRLREPEFSVSKVVVYVYRSMTREILREEFNEVSNISINEEVNRCIKAAVKYKWRVVEVIRDIDYTGRERNGLTRLMKLAKLHEVDAVLVYSKKEAFGECSRFIEEALEALGVRLIEVEKLLL